MISDRTRAYLLTALLAAPPVVMVGVVCYNLLPYPEAVPAVVAANDPEVNTAPFVKANSAQRNVFRIAGGAH